jgi:hypothetical protein
MPGVPQPPRQIFEHTLQAIFGDRLEALYLRVQRSHDTLYGPPTENDPKRATSRRPTVLLPPVVSCHWFPR